MRLTGVLVLIAIVQLAGCGDVVPRNTSLTPETGLICGELGYPSDWVPPMNIYAEDVRTGDVFIGRTNSSPSITGYVLEVSAPGTYRVFAWTVAGYMTEESMGSYYLGGCARSGDLPQELGMVEVTVVPGDTIYGVDIFCFQQLDQRVPLPPRI